MGSVTSFYPNSAIMLSVKMFKNILHAPYITLLEMRGEMRGAPGAWRRVPLGPWMSATEDRLFCL